MSIVAFWSSGKEQSGKTLSMVAIATYYAIEHNNRILIVSTGFNDETLNRCFWKERKAKTNRGLFGPNTNIAVQEGITGLARMMKSNKVAPATIANYTKTVYKDRLEVLQIFKGERQEYDELKTIYQDIINLADNYYDWVFVDVDNDLGPDIVQNILGNSNLVIASISQRLSTIDRFMELKGKMPILNSQKTLLLIGRYDTYSKYSIKNVSRYMGEKNRVLAIPYNTLFFESCEEATVADFFLKFRKTDYEDRNGIFLSEVKRACENIEYRVNDLKYRA